jgi:hypothetical protein
MIKITAKRVKFNADTTIGEQYINGKFVFHSLEDVVREPFVKVKGQTAIPYGDYTLSVAYSPKYKRDMVYVSNTSNPRMIKCPDGSTYEGVILNHIGNYAKDTEGCILCGVWDGKTTSITQSTATFNEKWTPYINSIKQNGGTLTITK